MTGESYVLINGVRHWVRRAGDGNGGVPLVVVHGGPGGTIYDFERLTGPALEAFVSVVYYEQRGSGRTDQPADCAYSMQLLVEDVEQLRQHLGVPRICLLGISFGGDLAAEYTVAHPEHVQKLILHGTGLSGPLAQSPQPAGFDAVAPDDQIRTAIRTAYQRGGPDAVWDVVDRETVDRFLFHQPGSARRVRHLWEEGGIVNTGKMAAALAKLPAREVPLIDQVAALDVPTLILIGLWDRNAGLDACRDLASRLPRARLRIFDNSAHFPNVDEPDRYVEEIKSFLADDVTPA